MIDWHHDGICIRSIHVLVAGRSLGPRRAPSWSPSLIQYWIPAHALFLGALFPMICAKQVWAAGPKDREAISAYIESLTALSTHKVLHCKGQVRSTVGVPPGYGLSPNEEGNGDWTDQVEVIDFDLFMTPDKYIETSSVTILQGASRVKLKRMISCDGSRYIIYQRQTENVGVERQLRPLATVKCDIDERLYSAAPQAGRHGVPIRTAFYNTFDFLMKQPSLLLAIESVDSVVTRSEFEGQPCIELAWNPPIRHGPSIAESFYFSLPPDVRLLGSRRLIEGSSVRICQLNWTLNRFGQPALTSAFSTLRSIRPDGKEGPLRNPTKTDFDKFEFIDLPPDFKWLVDIPPDAEIRDLCEESPIPTVVEVMEQEQEAERRWWLLVLGIVLVAGGIIVGLVVRRWRRR